MLLGICLHVFLEWEIRNVLLKPRSGGIMHNRMQVRNERSLR